MMNDFGDCFAKSGKDRCAALKACYCEIEGKCSFYKSTAQREAELKKYPFDGIYGVKLRAKQEADG